MDPNSNWRNDLSSESREKIVNKIMDTLQRHMPPPGPDGMSELRNIALQFEEKMYAAATNQQDYLRKISLKMFSLETKVHCSAGNSLPPNIPAGSSQKNSDPAAGIMQLPQIRNPAQPLATGLQITQAQTRQQSQNLQNSIQGGTMESSTGFASALSSMTGLTQATIPNVGGQISGFPVMTGISQSPMNNSTGQVLSQKPLPERAQIQFQSRQQQHQQQVAQLKYQQQSQAQQQQVLYQQQLQHQQQQLKLQQSQLQQQLQQQSHLWQQQSVLQQSQLQPSQQSVLQSGPQPVLQAAQQSILQQARTSVLQQSQQYGLQHTQPTSVQQTHQSVLRQQQLQQSIIQQQPSILQQQQSSMVQQSFVQPQPQLLGQQNNVSNMQQQHHLQHQSISN